MSHSAANNDTLPTIALDIPASHAKLVETPTDLLQESNETTTISPVRDYRAVQLDNGARVLLICDPATEKAALSTAVCVGQLHDGVDFPGRAHLLEHALFLGCEPFPQENELDSYLQQHGGHSNAYTDLEVTNYYLELSAGALVGALERWSAALSYPLFKEEMMEREINAVDSEHGKNKPQDFWRIYQLSKTILSQKQQQQQQAAAGDANSNMTHPYGSFGSGCLTSLLPESKNSDNAEASEEEAKKARIAALRQAVYDFYQRYYTAENTTICLLSSHSLDQLEAWVRQYFANLPTSGPTLENNQSSSLSIPPLLLSDTDNITTRSATRVDFVPLRPVYTLELHWPLPEIQSRYLEKPTQVLSHLLGDESPGSLLNALRHETPWVQELSADAGSRATSAFSVLILQFQLTQAGWEHVNEIVACVFAYLQMVQNGLPPYIYNELKLMGDMAFDFMSIPSSAADTVSNLSSQMHQYKQNPQHFLSGAYKYFAQELNQEALLKDFVQHMTPENMLIIVGAPEYGPQATSSLASSSSSADPKEWLTDPWYGTQYRITDVDTNTMAAWKKPTHDLVQHLHLPKPNEFLPSNFDLVQLPDNVMEKYFSKKDAPPVCLRNDEIVQLWYKPDTAFSMPKVNIFVSFPLCVTGTPILSTLWSEWQHEVSNMFAYSASMAGLHGEWVANPKRGTVELHVSGYSHKAPLLARRLLETSVMGSKDLLDEELWQRLVQKLRDQYNGFLMAQAYQHAIYYLDQCLEAVPTPRTIEQRLAELETLTLEDLLHFHDKAFLPSSGIQIMVHGNLMPENALELGRDIPKLLRATSPSTNEDTSEVASKLETLKTTKRTIQQRIVQLPDNSNFVFSSKAWNEENFNHCALQYFPIGKIDLVTNASLSLLKHLIAEPAYNQLRTQEQLGYVVFSQLKTSGDHVKGLVLLIQGDSKDPVYMALRMRQFWQDVRNQLVEMPAEEFAQHQQSLYDNFMERKKNLLQESAAHWNLISNQSFYFTRIAEIASHLRTLKKQDVLRLVDKNILYGSSLTIQMFGHGSEFPLNETEGTILIKDPVEFGRQQALFSLPASVPVDVVDLS